MAQWRDLVEFEVHEVISSAEAAERATSSYATDRSQE
jgi:hypothetical protein